MVMLGPKGWVKLAYDPALMPWVHSALSLSDTAIADPALAHWWVCEDTWFVGVDALDNDPIGTLPDGSALPESLMDLLHRSFGSYPFHKAQISVMRPGYPKPRDGEPDSAFRYRLNRDAAHVDGLLAEGPERRRRIREPHAYILGLPLNLSPVEAAPLVVWEGSHKIMRRAFADALACHPKEAWGDIDVTEAYQAARREVFAQCKRVVLHARPGEAYLLHRLALHGIAPWAERPDQVGMDRRIAYFRPELPSVADWINLP